MYKFTNGLVFYSKEEADKAINAGYKLMEKQLKVDDVIDEADKCELEPISESNKEDYNITGKGKRSVQQR